MEKKGIKSDIFSFEFWAIFLPLVAFFCSSLIFLLSSLYLFAKKDFFSPSLGDGKFKKKERIAYFNNQQINVPLSLWALPTLKQVLPAYDSQTKEEKRIEIDLSQQKLFAFEGDKLVYEFPVSSGRWALTPTGEFRIWAKLKYTLMHGGSVEDNTYYYLPNVPYTQYFYQGYGIHGTYWHNNFGQPMSHGCVNLATIDAEKLFYWTNPVMPEDKWVVYASAKEKGTRVIIYGKTPL